MDKKLCDASSPLPEPHPHGSACAHPGSDLAEDLSPSEAALLASALDVRRHLLDSVDSANASRPQLFSLVSTSTLIASQPAFAALLDPTTRTAAAADAYHLTPIAMDDMDYPGTEDTSEAGDVQTFDPLSPSDTSDVAATSDELANTLEYVQWPDIAVGGIVTMVRPVQSAGSGASTQDTAPGRIVVGVHENGDAWCVVDVPEAEGPVAGRYLLPDLVTALRASLGYLPETGAPIA
ncbi:hypothetical protein [Devriesea agamarum]|uniref:hypothetical protein n=1 Tax=Devriesea agamarum TaxID=472569 RepID=UPI00071DEF6D|nr:hypothetical protein [Devriesea agamarum]